MPNGIQSVLVGSGTWKEHVRAVAGVGPTRVLSGDRRGGRAGVAVVAVSVAHGVLVKKLGGVSLPPAYLTGSYVLVPMELDDSTR